MKGLIRCIAYCPPGGSAKEAFSDLVKDEFGACICVEASDKHFPFKCEKHGNVGGFFEIYGKEFCGKCVAEAIEKFIKDMG